MCGTSLPYISHILYVSAFNDKVRAYEIVCASCGAPYAMYGTKGVVNFSTQHEVKLNAVLVIRLLPE